MVVFIILITGYGGTSTKSVCRAVVNGNEKDGRGILVLAAKERLGDAVVLTERLDDSDCLVCQGITAGCIIRLLLLLILHD